MQEEFWRARRFLALIELDEEALAAFIREHRTGACLFLCILCVNSSTGAAVRRQDAM